MYCSELMHAGCITCMYFCLMEEPKVINEDRIVDIEIKIAAQEDMLETLNRTVYQQQKKIDELETLCSAMARHIKDLQEGASEAGTALEKPPHY